jgi:hypothetical protein
MSTYSIPVVGNPPKAEADEIYLVASGDLRLAANQIGWEAQSVVEGHLSNAFAKLGMRVKRGHPYDPELEHGFIWNQRMGMDVFMTIPHQAPIIVAEAVWQYSYHVLAGLRNHQGPILTVANWSGQWPGLVGLLNLNGSLTKMGVEYSSIWSEDFEDDYFLGGIEEWIRTGTISHDTSHVRDLVYSQLPEEERDLGQALADQLINEKAILGVFDEGFSTKNGSVNRRWSLKCVW